MQNKISIVIDAEQEATILQRIADLRAALPAGLITLTESERKSMPKMGDKSVAFVEKAINLASQNSFLAPSYVNLEEAHKDYSSYLALSHIIHALKPIMAILNDSEQLCGSEAMMPALSIFNLAKDGERRGIPGAKEAARDMGERFPGRGVAKPKDDTQK